MKPIELSQKNNVISFLMLGAICLLQAQAILAAEPPQSIEMQLREKLRATVLQLRTAEADRAALQSSQTQCADEKKKLTERSEALTKQVNDNKQTALVVDGLKAQVSRQEKEIVLLKEAVESCRQAAELAHSKAIERENERAKRAEETVIRLERLVADRQAKNLALYKIACEILQRYQKFGLGDALSAREPFIGITRVKLQNQVQEYQDKLINERTTLEKHDLDPDRDNARNQPAQSSK